jgi:hypothetical protein
VDTVQTKTTIKHFLADKPEKNVMPEKGRALLSLDSLIKRLPEIVQKWSNYKEELTKDSFNMRRVATNLPF